MGSKISGYTELTTPAADDEVEILDISDTSLAPTGTNKRIKWLTLITKMFASRFAADAGSTDTYVVTLDPVPAAYATGEHYRFKANTANTGPCTVNFNSLGAKTIKKAAGGITTDLVDNDIRAGQWVDLVYDGTNMQMQSLLGNAPAGGAGGFGDVVGPGSATDNALARFDSTTGKLIQDSTVTLDDTGALTVPEMAAPSTPGANKVAIYAKADGKVYSKDDGGAETLMSSGSAGAEAGANSDITSMDGLTGSLRAPTQIEDSNGNEVLKFGSTASAVNEVTVTNKATGNAPTVAATGGDTDVSLNLVSKGAGAVQANGVNVLLESLEVFASDLTTALTTGTGKGVFFMPYAMTVLEVFAGLATPQTSGSTFTVDINEAGVSILSTKITIDNGEDTSLTAATPPVISDTALAKGAKITIDIDALGDGTAKGLVVVISGVRG